MRCRFLAIVVHSSKVLPLDTKKICNDLRQVLHLQKVFFCIQCVKLSITIFFLYFIRFTILSLISTDRNSYDVISILLMNFKVYRMNEVDKNFVLFLLFCTGNKKYTVLTSTIASRAHLAYVPKMH